MLGSETDLGYFLPSILKSASGWGKELQNLSVKFQIFPSRQAHASNICLMVTGRRVSFP